MGNLYGFMTCSTVMCTIDNGDYLKVKIQMIQTSRGSVSEFARELFDVRFDTAPINMPLIVLVAAN